LETQSKKTNKTVFAYACGNTSSLYAPDDCTLRKLSAKQQKGNA